MRGRRLSITYNLSINDNGSGVSTPGSFALYVIDTIGDNAGLALYQVSLTSFTTLTNFSPRTVYDDGSGDTMNAGFTAFRSGSNIGALTGGQDTAGASVGSATLIYGMGQTADGFAAHNPFPGGTQDQPTQQSTWGVPLLIAKGTYNPAGPAPAFDTAQVSQANVFVSNGSILTVPADPQLTTTSVPEPAVSMVGLGLFAMSLLARRRR